MFPSLASELDLDAGLRRLGYAAFRPGQREAIEQLLRGGRILLVAPTGGGKSLSYQLPAMLLPGTTLVVSPLVSLMHDQVEALAARGVPATYLAATLEPGEIRRRLARAERGELRLLYAAPERLATPGFRGLLPKLRCPLVAIDEAHCISEWGHDFRPDYLELRHLLAELPGARVLACTATATPVVRDEIIARLGLPTDTPQLVRGFARPNLVLAAREVSGARERERAVDAVLAEALCAPGAGRGAAIVYAPTRRETDAEAARLSATGWRAAAYHAGQDGAQRDASQNAFAAGELEVVVATNAFGMGIDRADVRAVVHLAPPGTLEAYYQEVGRAGRDGAPAQGLLLLSAVDLARRRALLEKDALSPELLRHKWALFLELMRWAEGGSCRHDAILRYFGDEEETLAGCGRCDVCRRLDDTVSEFDPERTSLVVRKALSAVARIHGRFGLGAAARLLQGAADPRLERAGLERTRTFGALADHDLEWTEKLLRRCVTAGWVDLSSGERPLALLTDEGQAVMRGEREARLLLPSPAARKPPKAARSEPKASEGGGAGYAGAVPARLDPALEPGETPLFEALRGFRLEQARAQGVPPYVILHDRSLRDIARRRPASLDALRLCFGVGPAKAERWGEALLAVVRRG
jgi:ATP-dependent DNA helicase RecQ